MESLIVAFLQISVIGVLIISNTDNGSDGAEFPAGSQHQSHNMPPNAASGYPQSAPGYPPAPPDYYPPAPPGYPPGATGYPPGVPGYPPGASGYPPGVPGYPPGAAPGYRMPGIDLNNGFVAETLNAISKVSELAITGVKLPNRDVNSLSDPFCITYLRPFNAAPNDWVEFHQTETIWDDLSPIFAKKPLIPPSFGDKYSIMFKLYDADMNSTTHDILGHAECNLKELLSKRTMTLDLRIMKRLSTREIASRTSKIIITVEELIDNNNEAHLQIHGSNIEKKDRDMFGRLQNSDPYLMIFKQNPGTDTETLVHRTERKDNEVTPAWLPFTIPIKSLCNGKEDRPLKFICYDWDKKGGHDLIGEFTTTLERLREKCIHGETFDLRNVKSSRRNQIAGHIHIDKLEVIDHPTFTQFIRSGLQINVNIVIDFSAANGNIQRPESLHFQQPNGALNKYQQAINSVVTILEAYDFNKSFPVYGFAARNSKAGPVSNVFQVDPDSPECVGVYGVMEAYRKCISKPDFSFASPVKFAPVIRKVIESIRNPPPTQEKYFILLILTAGEITDLPDTEAAIQEASKLPISIIIVGIGEATGRRFDQMEKLDGDLVQKSASSQSATRSTRDIVQFVPLSKYVSNFVDSSGSLALAKELLAELPNQVTMYMKLRGFKPPVVASQHFMYGAPSMMAPGYGAGMGPPPPSYMPPFNQFPSFQGSQNFSQAPQSYYPSPQAWPHPGGYGAPPTDPHSAAMSHQVPHQYSGVPYQRQDLSHAPSSLSHQFSVPQPNPGPNAHTSR